MQHGDRTRRNVCLYVDRLESDHTKGGLKTLPEALAEATDVLLGHEVHEPGETAPLHPPCKGGLTPCALASAGSTECGLRRQL